MIDEDFKNIAQLTNDSKRELTKEEKERGDYDCPVCLNKRGWLVYEWHNGEEYECWKKCGCVNRMQTKLNIQKSGLSDMIKKLRFDNFAVTENHHITMRNKAQEFITNSNGKWLAFLGQSGCGKTHICTAVCNELLKQGKSVAYLRWAVELKRLKMNVSNVESYENQLDNIFNNDVIYIDDLFKRHNSSMPTDADVRLMFEIVDTAIAQNKTVIISGEDTQSKLIEIDEATAGRIIRQCGEFLTEVSKDPQKNYRLKEGY